MPKILKKLLQKAMVFTLSAAMLVGTPLSASATSLQDLYQVGDSGNNDADNSNSNTDTGTDTNTDTGSRPSVEDPEFNLQIDLGMTNVELSGSEGKRLTASLKWADAVPENWNEDAEKELLGKLDWESDNEKVVRVTPLNANRYPGAAMLRGRGDGEAVVTVSLKDETWKVDCSASVKVTVYRYATKLLFDNAKIAEDAYTGNSLVLDEYVKRYVGTTEVSTTADTLTYTLIDDGGKKATLKNGVLKLNKATEEGKPVKVAASGKNVSTTDNGSENGSIGIINIKVGTNATKLKFSGTGVKGSKLTWLVNDRGVNATVDVEVSGKKGNKDNPCTDTITWTSANDEIVTVANVTAGEKEVGSGETIKFAADKCTLALNAHKAGNTQIIGKVSSGRTFKLSVAVSAELTGVVLDTTEIPMYTGQIIDLNEMIIMQRFGTTVTSDDFTANGLVKWEFTDMRAMQKVAKLNAKTGVLEILKDCSKGPDDWKIAVRAINAKKCKHSDKHAFEVNTEKENEKIIQLAQVEISSITVQKVEDEQWTLSIKSGEKQNPTTKKDSINLGEMAEYHLVAEGTVTEKGMEARALTSEEAVNALAWTASGNGKTIRATKEGAYGYLTAIKKGSATITVSGVTKKSNKYAPIKATFKDTVNAPSQNITLSVKNSYIPATYKKGALADLKINNIKVALDKGTTTKNKASGNDIIDWQVSLADKDGMPKDNTGIKLSLGKVTIPASKYAIGDKLTVSATVRNTGASDSITMTIVYPTKKVVFKKYGENGNLVDVNTKGKGEDVSEGGLEVCAYIQSNVANADGEANGSERTEMASYTVSGKGAVYVKAGENGKLTIRPLKAGAVTIKFVMTDGKKANLKANIVSVPSYITDVQNAALNIGTIFENIVFE